MVDFYNQPPQGFVRGSDGWLRIAKTPQVVMAKKLKVENEELKSRLEQLEAVVDQLVSKKKK